MTAPIPGKEPGVVTTKSGGSSSNVRVVSRVRPLAKYELDKGCKPVVTKVPHIDKGGPEVLQIVGPDQRWFELDAVMTESCTQQEVYERSGAHTAIAEDLFAGFNCTILAYGQTGAGKVSKNYLHRVLGSLGGGITRLYDSIYSHHCFW